MSATVHAINRCRWCEAGIVWARTVAGRQMPLDPEPKPYPEGNVELTDDGAVVHGQPSLDMPDRLYVPHFATCPSWGPTKGTTA